MTNALTCLRSCDGDPPLFMVGQSFIRLELRIPVNSVTQTRASEKSHAG